MRNGLSIPTNKNNLVTLFIMREAGLEVNVKPKIHCKEPTVEDHSIYAEEHDLRIPLKLDGTFLHFKTRALAHDAMEYPENCRMIFS